MTNKKIYALKTAITGSTNIEVLLQDIPRSVLIAFYKRNANKLDFQRLINWLDGIVEISDEELYSIMKEENCRLTEYSFCLP